MPNFARSLSLQSILSTANTCNHDYEIFVTVAGGNPGTASQKLAFCSNAWAQPVDLQIFQGTGLGGLSHWCASSARLLAGLAGSIRTTAVDDNRTSMFQHRRRFTGIDSGCQLGQLTERSLESQGQVLSDGGRCTISERSAR